MRRSSFVFFIWSYLSKGVKDLLSCVFSRFIVHFGEVKKFSFPPSTVKFCFNFHVLLRESCWLISSYFYHLVVIRYSNPSLFSLMALISTVFLLIFCLREMNLLVIDFSMSLLDTSASWLLKHVFLGLRLDTGVSGKGEHRQLPHHQNSSECSPFLSFPHFVMLPSR